MKSIVSLFILFSAFLGFTSEAYGADQSSSAVDSIQLTQQDYLEIREEYKDVFQTKDVIKMNLKAKIQIAKLLIYNKLHQGLPIQAYEFVYENPSRPNKNEEKFVRETFYIKNNSYVTFVNFSLNSNQPRMFVIDIQNRSLVGVYMVAHGQGTSNIDPQHPNPADSQKVVEARRFSNAEGSLKSSLGLFITDRERHINQHHHSAAALMHGLDGSLNNYAFVRFIEIHGGGNPDGSGSYVDQNIGVTKEDSKGCFVIDQKFVSKNDQDNMSGLIDKLVGGTLLYAWIDPELLKGFSQ